MDESEIKELENNSLSKIVILKDIELKTISNIFIQIPFEYSGMGAVGKKYEAIKDFLKWNDLDVKYWTPILLKMGEVWVSSQANK